ncbi:2-oxoglutarate and iron-dependent oxygenase domain-containing protein 3 [Tetranychus urticae]|uniref:Prolyl 4-hydroxylase alpha subunit Fe(2+) 2OG dioxygenase domain-containing protein n=1 Tax=Tetranychus urticae TaxID=32264 RepID=T1KCQ2_TETUR|nr:2-oxoglutarate and iron-dependent oxygenase domain-containing protein 3 [Tetranychus urticae]XP_025016824.1 2-oxoglutarate and iron-dependent oxygenase domain-containing protein 3 [Tetranychus urticae]
MPPFNPSSQVSNRFKGQSQTKLINRRSIQVTSQVDRRNNEKSKKLSSESWDASSVKLTILMISLVSLTLYILSPSQVNNQQTSPESSSQPSSQSSPQPYVKQSNSSDNDHGNANPQVGDYYEQQEGQFFNFLATVDQHFPQISLHEVDCHPTGYKKEAELGLNPQRCGTMITDELVSRADTMKLRQLAMKVIDRMGQTNFHNRESINLKWINLHNLFRNGTENGVLTESDFQLIKNTSEAARSAVGLAFGLPEEYLMFHGVCQFTRYHPVVQFREFRHIDKLRSPNLIVTSILWLSTIDEDFGGGRTEFLTGPGPEPFSPLLVEPKIGRYAAWTSSYENPHAVQELDYGYRYALIFAFTVLEGFGHPDLESFREWALTTDALK